MKRIIVLFLLFSLSLSLFATETIWLWDHNDDRVTSFRYSTSYDEEWRVVPGDHYSVKVDSRDIYDYIFFLQQSYDGKAWSNSSVSIHRREVTEEEKPKRTRKKATTEEVSSSISTAIDDLIGGAPATYDTLKEIADYIAAHKEVTDALNAAIGNKVDKVEGKGLSTNDLTDELLAKINSLDASNQHTHSNKSVLDGITSSDVSNWNGKTKVYVQAAQPESLADGDVFIQITE